MSMNFPTFFIAKKKKRQGNSQNVRTNIVTKSTEKQTRYVFTKNSFRILVFMLYSFQKLFYGI